MYSIFYLKSNTINKGIDFAKAVVNCVICEQQLVLLYF